MRAFFITAISMLLLVSCNQAEQGQGEKSVEEIMNDSKIDNADIIRNPVSADTPEDTVNVAKMTFDETTFDFGEVEEGEIVEHTYAFTNTGRVPLIINSARSTCGCTVPEWPKDPIPPGESGEIIVRFNTQNKRNQQNKPISILANTYPATTKVFLTGVVRPEQEAMEQ